MEHFQSWSLQKAAAVAVLHDNMTCYLPRCTASLGMVMQNPRAEVISSPGMLSLRTLSKGKQSSLGLNCESSCVPRLSKSLSSLHLKSCMNSMFCYSLECHRSGKTSCCAPRPEHAINCLYTHNEDTLCTNPRSSRQKFSLSYIYTSSKWYSQHLLNFGQESKKKNAFKLWNLPT